LAFASNYAVLQEVTFIIMKKLVTLIGLGLMAVAGLTPQQVAGQTHSAPVPAGPTTSWDQWQSDAARKAFWLERGATLTEPADVSEKAAFSASLSFANLAEAQGAVIPEADRHTVCRLNDGTVVTFWSLARMETLWQRHMKAAHSRSEADGAPQSTTPASKKS
jgi:hypothetical protein